MTLPTVICTSRTDSQWTVTFCSDFVDSTLGKCDGMTDTVTIP